MKISYVVIVLAEKKNNKCITFRIFESNIKLEKKSDINEALITAEKLARFANCKISTNFVKRTNFLRIGVAIKFLTASMLTKS
jgi:hypothetical protein